MNVGPGPSSVVSNSPAGHRSSLLMLFLYTFCIRLKICENTQHSVSNAYTMNDSAVSGDIVHRVVAKQKCIVLLMCPI